MMHYIVRHLGQGPQLEHERDASSGFDDLLSNHRVDMGSLRLPVADESPRGLLSFYLASQLHYVDLAEHHENRKFDWT